MGTRGLLAFKSGDVKATYCHFDSYPGGLGTDVLAFLRTVLRTHDGITDCDELRDLVRELEVVSDGTAPTKEDIEKLRQYADVRVSTGELNDWYVLLRGTQGDPGKILAAGYMEDGFEFGYNSLMCEWGYVLNLDEEQLDVYRGFNKSGTSIGLWAFGENLPNRSGYGPITLVKSYPFNDLPTDDQFIQDLEGDNSE